MRPFLVCPPEMKRAETGPIRVDAEGRFEGYASLFGVEDLGRDIVERGAFTASLARRGASGVKMLWQHDPAEPIGRWLEIREDGRGLAVRGQILTGLSKGREVLALLDAGVLDGLSIGFKTVRGRRDPRSGIRRLHEVDLWEISLVTFPMQPEARVGPLSTRGVSALALEAEAHVARMRAIARDLAPAAAAERRRSF
jgi:HK97 family phage prohead protease